MAWPIPTGFDPLKMMEFLGNLPEEEQEEIFESTREAADNNTADKQEQRERAQEAMVQHFRQMRSQFVDMGGLLGVIPPGKIGVRFSNYADVKPSTSTRSLASLAPMIGDELDLGTTHRGRYLCGWVAVDDAFFGISSSVLLIEDVMGYLVEAAVYDLVDSNLPPRERQYRVAAQFPKGKPVVILEPYYKVRVDGTVGIRVDDPAEITAWSDVPTDLESWKQLGNKFFRGLNVQNGGRGALSCYQRALESVPQLHEIVVLLTNIATCRFKTGDWETAVQLSGAAVHLDPTYFKGWLRLAAALAANAKKGERSGRFAALAVAHARAALTNLTRQQVQALKSTLIGKTASIAADKSKLQSYAGWCVDLVPQVFEVLIGEDTLEPELESAIAWRQEGSEYFNAGNIQEAEKCYCQALVATASNRQDASVVLNNSAAMYLKLHQENSNVPGISFRDGNDTFASQENQIPTLEAALLNCTVAGILDPLNYKAWARRTRCLGKLGTPPEERTAELVLVRDNVVAQSENRQQIEEFVCNISKEIQRSRRLTTSKPVHEVSDVSTDAQRDDRDAMRSEKLPSSWHEQHREEETLDQYIARMEQFENMSRLAFSMANSNPHRQKELPREMEMYYANPPPQVHIEFPKLRGWPDGIDPVFARKVLYKAYLDSCSNPWIKALVMREHKYYEKIDPADLVKRWHGTGAVKILSEQAGSLKWGDIVDGHEVESDFVPAYDARIRSNFANNPSRAEVYFFGTTHVAIGFNDFSSLVTASIRESSNTAAPLKFVGFEMSEFAVAKCKVVAQMLGSPNIPATSVMEVWFSSTWSSITLGDFRKSLKTVLSSLVARNENSRVLSYLNHWASAQPISAAKARSEFVLNLERYNSKVLGALCSFRREIDRLDLTYYLLTGEMRASVKAKSEVASVQVDGNKSETDAGMTRKMKRNKKKNARKKLAKKEKSEKKNNTQLVGSLTMWNVPPGAPPLEEDVAFNAVDFMTLLEDYSARQKKQKGSADKLSVVDLFSIHILQNLQRLRGLMLSGKLTIEVLYGVVKAVRGEGANDAKNLDLIARIASMRPYTISWSNVLDYFMPDDFHDLARRCSMHGDCMHYGYSMNWSTQVLGASLLDYSPESPRDLKLINDVLDIALGFKPGTTDMFKTLGLDKLLLLPCRENPLNSTAYVLAQVYKKNWIQHFLDKGELTQESAHRLGGLCTPVNCGLQKGTVDLAMPSPLYRTSLTLYMSWCYDPEMNLQPANDPFAVSAAADPEMLRSAFEHMSEDQKMKILGDMMQNNFML